MFGAAGCLRQGEKYLNFFIFIKINGNNLKLSSTGITSLSEATEESCTVETLEDITVDGGMLGYTSKPRVVTAVDKNISAKLPQ